MTSTNTTGHLLVISLGPIQDFIATARRCQDLWFGSWLLSELARTVATSVDEATGGGTVVFPAGLGRDAEGLAAGVANVILAVLPDGTSPREVAKKALEGQRARLLEITEAAWAGCDGKDGLFHREVALRQVNELMEFQWVAVPRTGDYAADRTRAYERLAAVKNTRVWEQPSWTTLAGAGVPKSSLDGERESVIDERAYKTLAGEALRRRFGVKGAERLCGLGLMKRLGQQIDDAEFRSGKPPFHSTAHIAAAPTLRRFRDGGRAAQAAARVLLGAWSEAGLDVDRFRVASGGPATLDGFDGSLLFPSRNRDHLEHEAPGFDQLGRTEQDRRIDAVAEAQRTALAAVGAPTEPCPYYAFVLADGDSMGKAIDAIRSVEGHRALGAALNAFAVECREIVTRHEGTLIFAGGDDVLALLPLHTVLACGRELAETFVERVQPAVKRFADAKDLPLPTLSVGVGISHCREPMSDARRLAKRAEKIAKSHPDKNALAVIVAKRSGGDLTVSGSWTDHPLDSRLMDWVSLVEHGDLSAKTAHDLEAVAAHYASLSEADQGARTNEILALTGQVLRRKRRVGGDEKASGATIERLLAAVRAPGAAMAERVRRLSEELQVARLLVAGRKHAGLTSVEPGEVRS